ncbi:MAG: TAP42-like protein [Benniella sp.]|nr:MAG: TAP42-like protein [Benniella sp.]
MAGNDDASLAQVFQRAEALFLDIQNGTLAPDELQSKVGESIKGFERSRDMVRQLSLFSENEFMEDISTKDLRYLLTEYYLGGLFLKRVSQDRLADLDSSKEHFDHYLHQCETHDILTAQDKNYLEQITANTPRDAATQRNEKMARFKREKEMKNRIEEFHKELGTTSSGYEGELSSELEDKYRDFVLLYLQHAIFQTMEELVAIQREIPMVKEMQERRAAQGSRDNRTSDRSREDDGDARVDTRPAGWDASGPLLDPKGKVRRPFVITNQRAEIMQGVFRPGHSLPTMTVEEYLQQEMERGNFLSGGTEEPKKKEIDDNDEEALNAETIKARNWDDFKDDNPKGWGNRGGRVG